MLGFKAKKKLFFRNRTREDTKDRKYFRKFSNNFNKQDHKLIFITSFSYIEKKTQFLFSLGMLTKKCIFLT